MSTSVSCPGCARDIPILSDDARSEIRCPACNFRFARPAPADAITVKPRRSRKNVAAIVTCAHCGETLRTGGDDGHPVRCPVCANPLDSITAQPKSRPAPSESGRPISTNITTTPRRSSDDEDDEAYTFAEPIQLCPNCQREVTDDAVVCVGCGYHRERGEVLVREFTVVDRSWAGSLSEKWRCNVFLAGEAFSCLVLVGAILGDMLEAGLIGWLGATVLLAYVCGTFYRVAVSRTPGGQVKASKQWRFCFIPLRPSSIQLRAYEGIRLGKVSNDIDVWDWVLLLILVLYGGIPGVIWWCFAFQRDQFYVGLLQNHGSVTLELYRGWDEAQAKDMVKVIRDVGGYAR